MVKNAKDVKDLTKVSFSFIPSLKCNNRCPFCMYGASPENTTKLDYEAVKVWLKTVQWDKVIGWGLYGGEPSIEMGLYQKFYELLPTDLPKFIITNGAWSKSNDDTKAWLNWCAGKFHIIVSGTAEHRKHQRVSFIKELAKQFDGAFTIKGDEEMHPMGRLARANWDCSKKCIYHKQPIRLGIFPTGHIILQNCDGVYPVVGHISRTTFVKAFNEGVRVRTRGCNKGCVLNINDLVSQLEQ